jgi:hypothetical protein
MLKTSLGILGLEYSTAVANYNLDGSLEVESLFLSNVHDGDLTVDIRITRGGESISLLKSSTIKRGGYIPFLGLRLPLVGGGGEVLNLQPGDALEARCSVEGGAHFVSSHNETRTKIVVPAGSEIAVSSSDGSANLLFERNLLTSTVLFQKNSTNTTSV